MNPMRRVVAAKGFSQTVKPCNAREISLDYLSDGVFLVCAGRRRRWAHDDICAICGQPIQGTIYLMTDKVTGEKVLVCSDCIKLPLCSICGLPVKDNGVALPDGRHLCARDAKTVVLKADDIEQICGQVKDDLDRLFSRFTSFPTNVDVTVIDRIDVNSMFYTEGNGSESPDLLGCIRPETVNDTDPIQNEPADRDAAGPVEGNLCPRIFPCLGGRKCAQGAEGEIGSRRRGGFLRTGRLFVDGFTKRRGGKKEGSAKSLHARPD